MAFKRSLLVGLVILPGIASTAISTYYLFPEWDALTDSHARYQKLAQSGAPLRELSIAQAAETRHRINCFAEGVGALLGLVIVSIGVHGFCILPPRQLKP